MRRARKLRAALRRRLGLGPFRSVHPVSNSFGYDRGSPVDRVYIEQFLHECRDAIHGTTLEIGDDEYTSRFGGAATSKREVLHVDPAHSVADYRGDIVDPGTLPAARFDCAVVTQTLHLIYDMPAAVRQLHRSLVPGGTLLLTVPGISPIARDQWGETWFWSLTPLSLGRLLGDAFGAGNVRVCSYGNVLTATAFLQGYAAEEIERGLFEPTDPRFPVIVAASAVRGRE